MRYGTAGKSNMVPNDVRNERFEHILQFRNENG